MGRRFDISSSEIIGFLIAPNAEPPPASVEALQGLLASLADPEHVQPPLLLPEGSEWLDRLAQVVARSRRKLVSASRDLKIPALDPDQLRAVLDPIIPSFTRFDLLVMPISYPERADEATRFGMQISRIPTRGILVLHAGAGRGETVRVMRPSPGTAEAIRRRAEWPGALFMLRWRTPHSQAAASPTGERESGGAPADQLVTRFVPLSQAFDAALELADAMDRDRQSWWDGELHFQQARRVLTSLPAGRGARSRRRILHLSDLRFGARGAAQTQSYLTTHLHTELRRIDRIVISGNLFDRPRRKDARAFRKFADGLKQLGSGEPVVVAGDHDQKVFGNSLFGTGRRLRALANVRLAPVIHDPQMKVVFLCFDSTIDSRDAARGRVSTEQLLAVAAVFDTNNGIGTYDGHLKVAVVHHHPYPFPAPGEVPLLDPRPGVGQEPPTEMEEADRFLTWCTRRGVSLILHGHEPTPRLIADAIDDGSGRHEITTVGCGTSSGINDQPLAFNLIEWNDSMQSWTVDLRLDRGDGQGFRPAAIESHR